MRKLLLVLLFILNIGYLYSQKADTLKYDFACSDLVVIKEDKVTGEIERRGEPMFVKNNKEYRGIVLYFNRQN